jgi:uncharacterized membrane protein YhhN
VPTLVYCALVLLAFHAPAVATKPLPVLSLAIFAARRDRLFAAGLLASAAGDAVLAIRGHFVAGLVCFLIAHAIYVAAFARRARPNRARIGASVVLSAATTALAAFIVPHAGALAIPVAAYVVVITAMGVAALLADASILLPIGAILFIASDTLLALNLFVAQNRAAAVLILPTYYAAQLLLFLGWLW